MEIPPDSASGGGSAALAPEQQLYGDNGNPGAFPGPGARGTVWCGTMAALFAAEAVTYPRDKRQQDPPLAVHAGREPGFSAARPDTSGLQEGVCFSKPSSRNI